MQICTLLIYTVCIFILILSSLLCWYTSSRCALQSPPGTNKAVWMQWNCISPQTVCVSCFYFAWILDINRKSHCVCRGCTLDDCLLHTHLLKGESFCTHLKAQFFLINIHMTGRLCKIVGERCQKFSFSSHFWSRVRLNKKVFFSAWIRLEDDALFCSPGSGIVHSSHRKASLASEGFPTPAILAANTRKW